MNKIPTVLILCLLASPARALVTGGVDQTFGKNDYMGTNVHVGVSLGDFSITPEYRRYSDQDTDGAFNTFQTRLGLDTRWVGIGATAGGTARHDLYSNIFGGADVAFTLSPTGEGGIRRIGGPGRAEAPTGKGLARVDFGGGLLGTHHKQDSDLVTQGSTLDQANAHGFVGVSFLDILISGRYTKSYYNKDLKNATAPTPRYEPVAGHAFYNASYPDQSLDLTAEFSMLPMVAPYVGYTHTKYKEIGSVRPGETRAYAVGVRVGLKMLSATAAYQRVSVTAGEDRNFTEIAAGLRF